MSNWQRWKGIMKCYPFEEKRLSKWSPPYIVQPKYDGVRCKAVPLETGGYILLSSEENVIHSVPHINDELNRLKLKASLDGELYCHGMSFEEILSITSRTVNLSSDYHKIQFHVFDIVNKEPQMRRIILIEALRGLTPSLKVTPFWLCEDLNEIMRVYDTVLKMEYEGIIVRNFFNQYVERRSTQVMKFKPKKEDTYEILGYQEEINKDGVPKDSLGALVCSSGDGNTFSVGSGFTREQRETFWKNRHTLIGKQLRVAYQHLTDKKIPRFPVFMEIVERYSGMEVVHRLNYGEK